MNEIWDQLLSEKGALFAVVPVLIAFASYAIAQRTLAASSLYDTIIGRYADPRPLKIEGVSHGKKLEFGSLRAAASWARSMEQSHPARWEEESKRFADSGEHTLENQISYHIASRLNDLGSAVFTGGLSIHPVLAIVSDVIIDDWLICHHWIDAYRDREKAHAISVPGVHYHRRYAEALAAVAVIYLKHNWRYPPLDRIDGAFQRAPLVRLLEILVADRRTIKIGILLSIGKILPFKARFILAAARLFPRLVLRFLRQSPVTAER